MAYFQHRPQESQDYTRQFAPPRSESREEDWDEYGEEPEYDDGFDELSEEEEEEEISEEELRLEKRRKYRLAAGFGDLGATLVGVVAILALLYFIISMLQFLSSDFSQHFSLLQIRI